MKTGIAQLRLKRHFREAIKQTLLYAHIFDSPLTRHELWYYLKTKAKIRKDDFYYMLNFLPRGVKMSNGYYYLTSNKNVVIDRSHREAVSRRKFQIAKKVGNLLSIIPTILYIGVSGSLSMKHAVENDDIDFFIITRKNSLWITRLFCLLILEIFNLRRSKFSRNPRDKICINMLIDETQLKFPKDRQDIYTSQEIAQLKTLYSRSNTVLRFYHLNAWINSFMPNVLSDVHKISKSNSEELLLGSCRLVGNFLLPIILFEKLAEKIQLWSIKKNQTSETVSKSFVAFHPFDYREYVLEKYKILLINHNLRYPFTYYKQAPRKYKNININKADVLSPKSFYLFNSS